jgi:polysaccharide export outer membrane protein
MAERRNARLVSVAGLVMLTWIAGAGCQTCSPSLLAGTGCPTDSVGLAAPSGFSVPRELNKISQPTYVIEIPDILQIDTVRVVPRPPYRIAPLDSIVVTATGVLPDEPITGAYGVEPEGTINLGPSYGSFSVAGQTLAEARATLEKALKETFKNAQVRVGLGTVGGIQQIRGQHLVRPDGTVGLGKYGDVYVVGLNLAEAKTAIEVHLAGYLLEPEVNVDVYSYNSKAYYIVTDGGGYGEQVYRFPFTGNETVLDAISQINGLPAVASKKRIWVARPAPAEATGYQVLPIDWKAITRGGATATNYQLLPGDRLFVEAEPLIALDSALAKVFAPIERVFGVTLLGSAVVRSLSISSSATGTGGLGGF